MMEPIVCFAMALAGWFIAMRRIHCLISGNNWSTVIMAVIEELLAVASIILAIKTNTVVSIAALTIGAMIGVRLEYKTRKK